MRDTCIFTRGSLKRKVLDIPACLYQDALSWLLLITKTCRGSRVPCVRHDNIETPHHAEKYPFLHARVGCHKPFFKQMKTVQNLRPLVRLSSERQPEVRLPAACPGSGLRKLVSLTFSVSCHRSPSHIDEQKLLPRSRYFQRASTKLQTQCFGFVLPWTKVHLSAVILVTSNTTAVTKSVHNDVTKSGHKSLLCTSVSIGRPRQCAERHCPSAKPPASPYATP